MRVRVGLARFSVCGPAGMSDPAGSRKRSPVVCLDRQIPQLSGCFYHFGQFGSVPYRKSGRVIAPVFQSGQPVQQNRRSLMRSRKPNNSAHSVSLRIKLDEMKQTTYRVCRRFVFKAPMNSEMILTYRIAGE